MNWITTRSKHPKQSQQTQDEFKKFQIETILKIPGHVALDDVLVWFQDEARFGQRNTTTRIWAEKGTRPRPIQKQQFEYAYLYGAVCINTGEVEAIVSPVNNTQASWHQSYLGKEYSNLTIIHIPSYSPELNPIEQVWSWLRKNELANRCFDNYEDIVDSVCCAWNRFSENKSSYITLL